MKSQTYAYQTPLFLKLKSSRNLQTDKSIFRSPLTKVFDLSHKNRKFQILQLSSLAPEASVKIEIYMLFQII